MYSGVRTFTYPERGGERACVCHRPVVNLFYPKKESVSYNIPKRKSNLER
jgi:hypothetical protein